MKNIDSGSGFMVMLPHFVCKEWRGSDDDGQDYDFFCDNSDEYVSISAFRDCRIVIMGGEPTSFWIHQCNSYYYIFRVIYAESDFEHVLPGLVSGLNWCKVRGILGSRGDYIFFDPALSYDEAKDGAVFGVMSLSANSEIDSSMYVDDKYSLIVHRFMK